MLRRVCHHKSCMLSHVLVLIKLQHEDLGSTLNYDSLRKIFLAYSQHLQGAAGCLHGIFTRVTYPLNPPSSLIPSIPTLPAHVPSLTRSFWHLNSVSCMGSSSFQILRT